MFTANLYCNKKPYANYIGKWNRATSTLHKSARTASKTKRGIFKNYFLFIILTINERMVFCLYDISDMINQVGDADLKNNDIFIKTPAIEIRKSLLHVDFGLENSFCDAHQLKQSWKETKIPDFLVLFFVALFNISSTKMMRSEMTRGTYGYTFEDCLVEERNEEETQDSILMSKAKSLFQITYHHVTKGRNKTLSHAMDVHVMYALHEKCPNTELFLFRIQSE